MLAVALVASGGIFGKWLAALVASDRIVGKMLRMGGNGGNNVALVASCCKWWIIS